MARGQTLLTAFKGRKRNGTWADADHNLHVLDIERWSQTLPFGDVGFGVYRSSNDAAVANGADASIAFNRILYDNEGFWRQNFSNNVAIVPYGYGGTYALHGFVRLTAASPGNFVYPYIFIVRNGTSIAIAMGQIMLDATQGQVSTVYRLQAGDGIKLAIANRSGAAVTVAGSGTPTSNTPIYPSLFISRIALPARPISS